MTVPGLESFSLEKKGKKEKVERGRKDSNKSFNK